MIIELIAMFAIGFALGYIAAPIRTRHIQAPQPRASGVEPNFYDVPMTPEQQRIKRTLGIHSSRRDVPSSGLKK